MRFTIFPALAVLTLIVVAQGQATSSRPASRPVLGDMLGLSAGQSDILGPLAKAIAGVNTPSRGQETNVALDKLADALLSSAGSSQLEKKILANISLASFHDFQSAPDWTYGLYADRIELSSQLLSGAKAVAKSDPAKASMYARASILLGEQEGFVIGPTMVSKVGNDVEFAKLAGLNPTQATNLSNYLKAMEADERAFEAAFAALIQNDDQFIGNALITDVQVETTLKKINAARALTRRPTHAYLLIQETWTFRNTCKDRKASAAVKSVEQLLADWKSKETDKQITKWLSDALTTDGPPLRHPRAIQMDDDANQ